MKVQTASLKVLKEAGKPLHATEIAERIMKKSDGEQGLSAVFQMACRLTLVAARQTVPRVFA